MPHNPQPFCKSCFLEKMGSRGRGLVAITAKSRNKICCMCGNQTDSGLYLRVDPDTINFRGK